MDDKPFHSACSTHCLLTTVNRKPLGLKISLQTSAYCNLYTPLRLYGLRLLKMPVGI